MGWRCQLGSEKGSLWVGQAGLGKGLGVGGVSLGEGGGRTVPRS